MKTPTVSGDLAAAIAAIEMHRQKMEKVAGLGASCDAALRKLREILGREKQRAAPVAAVGAITAEIGRIKALMDATTHRPAAGYAPASRRKDSWLDAQRNPGRNKGRRTMGRAGGR